MKDLKDALITPKAEVESPQGCSPTNEVGTSWEQFKGPPASDGSPQASHIGANYSLISRMKNAGISVDRLDPVEGDEHGEYWIVHMANGMNRVCSVTDIELAIDIAEGKKDA